MCENCGGTKSPTFDGVAAAEHDVAMVVRNSMVSSNYVGDSPSWPGARDRMGTPGIITSKADLRGVGPFKNALQIAASADMHELLNDPVGKATTPAPLTYHGGPTIVGGRLVNVYLGPSVNTADFDEFTNAICSKGFYLSPDGKDATPTVFVGGYSFPYPFGNNPVSDAQIGAYISSLLGAQKLPTNDGKTMYSIIMPSGTTVSLPDGKGGFVQSCSAFCGYHTKTPSGIYYQVICDPACAGCHGNFTPNQARMMVQAHEYGEWRSDPDGNAWYSDDPSMRGFENGDECAWQGIAWGPAAKGWMVQPLAVNGKGCYVGLYQGDPTPPPPPPPVVKDRISLPQSFIPIVVNGTRYLVNVPAQVLS